MPTGDITTSCANTVHLLDLHEMTKLIFSLNFMSVIFSGIYMTTSHFFHIKLRDAVHPSSIGMWQLPKVIPILLSQRHWRKLFIQKMLSLGLATLLHLVWSRWVPNLTNSSLPHRKKIKHSYVHVDLLKK